MTDQRRDEKPPAEPPERVAAPEDEAFWAAIDAGRLDLVRCDGCGAWSSFARSCVQCGSAAYSWQPACGRGTVRSFVVFERPYNRYFATQIPYNVAAVQLEEGPEIVTNVVDVPLAEIEVGMEVRIEIRERDGRVLPQAVRA